MVCLLKRLTTYTPYNQPQPFLALTWSCRAFAGFHFRSASGYVAGHLCCTSKCAGRQRGTGVSAPTWYGGGLAARAGRSGTTLAFRSRRNGYSAGVRVVRAAVPSWRVSRCGTCQRAVLRMLQAGEEARGGATGIDECVWVPGCESVPVRRLWDFPDGMYVGSFPQAWM